MPPSPVLALDGPACPFRGCGWVCKPRVRARPGCHRSDRLPARSHAEPWGQGWGGAAGQGEAGARHTQARPQPAGVTVSPPFLRKDSWALSQEDSRLPPARSRAAPLDTPAGTRRGAGLSRGLRLGNRTPLSLGAVSTSGNVKKVFR